MGADAWRRTGVLTFDGNARVKSKVTYDRIRRHLEEKYDTTFSYGTVVQLCVPRNRHRRSAKNYRGIAHVTSRRARKGFTLRYNPDSHWSAALYRTLNLIQYTDGSNITNINRDDASGFRLDTLFTHSQYTTPVVKGHETLITHTDYVNKYPSVLQTTSYNFSATKTTGELCAGVVKAQKVYPKNPPQHFADLKMLQSVPELESAFVNPVSSEQKLVECIRVDGATDEGPSHEEVQFWWTVRHIEVAKLVTLVSARSSGSSYLNRVELQNGCMVLGHANLFIPSTLGGSCISPNTGGIDKDKLKTNLELATEVYLSRVDGCPCGDNTIHLFKGADSGELQEKRTYLQVFLKGSKRNKDELRKTKPELYKYFQNVWAVKERHQVPDLPVQYLFLLVCCFTAECWHPLCRAQKRLSATWFRGGPSVSSVPFPVPDPSRPWGGINCDACKGFCAGHFLSAEEALAQQNLAMMKPPSTHLLQMFQSLKGAPTPDQVTSISKSTLLTEEEVKMWLEHLSTVQANRKRGAAKAAQTRQKRKGSCRAPDCYCGFCGGKYELETDEVEVWVACDKCETWFHADCVNLDVANQPEHFYCTCCSPHA